MEAFKITKIKAGKMEIVEDFVSREIPLTIRVDNNELATILASPDDLKDLVKGFLFTSGFITQNSDLKDITLDTERWIADATLINQIQDEKLVFKRLYTPGCGKGTLFYNAFDLIRRKENTSAFRLTTKQIEQLMKDFAQSSVNYVKTGGVHSAAITEGNGLIVFKEDIGRHNALDKIIGYMISKNISFENKAILTSGRISSEVLMKVKKCEIPILISRGAPTNQAVRHAREMGITLVGFARGLRMNIYSHETRIIFNSEGKDVEE